MRFVLVFLKNDNNSGVSKIRDFRKCRNVSLSETEFLLSIISAAYLVDSIFLYGVRERSDAASSFAMS